MEEGLKFKMNCITKKWVKMNMINYLKKAREGIANNDSNLFYNSFDEYCNEKSIFLAHLNTTPYHKFTRLDNLANEIYIRGSDKFNRTKI